MLEVLNKYWAKALLVTDNFRYSRTILPRQTAGFWVRSSVRPPVWVEYDSSRVDGEEGLIGRATYWHGL